MWVTEFLEAVDGSRTIRCEPEISNVDALATRRTRMANDELEQKPVPDDVTPEEEEEDRALYCPRCGEVVISNEEMVGFPCIPQPACEHVRYVFDDFNHGFLYLSDELEKRISALRKAAEDKDEDFSDFDWAFEEGPKEFDTLQRTDEVDLSPFLRQTVKTQNSANGIKMPFKGRLSHGFVSTAVYEGVQTGSDPAVGEGGVARGGGASV